MGTASIKRERPHSQWTTLIVVGIVVGYLGYQMVYPMVYAELRRPQDPDRLPLFSFLKQLDIVGKGQKNQSVEVRGGRERDYPNWWYKTKMKPQMIAHNLKSALAKAKDWTLIFPDLNEPYETEASHRTNGKVDWTLKTWENQTSDIIITFRG